MSTKIPFNPKSLEKALNLINSLNNRRRLTVLCMLLDKQMTVTEMAQKSGLSLSAMSQHLRVLKKAHLVKTEKHQQTVSYRLEGNEVETIISALKKMYC